MCFIFIDGYKCSVFLIKCKIRIVCFVTFPALHRLRIITASYSVHFMQYPMDIPTLTQGYPIDIPYY